MIARSDCIEITVQQLRCVLFFFFQAEDGIRDYKVTGVQTCALPISLCPIERISSAEKSSLCELGKHLSGEDRQVLADAMSAKASVLYTHDSEFFRDRKSVV